MTPVIHHRSGMKGSCHMLQSEKSARTRRKFRQAARELFLEQGFDHTSIAEIVARAGYSTGAFYRHYKTKSDILGEVWSDFVEEYIHGSIEGAMKTESLEEAIDYLILRDKEYFEDPMFSCYYAASVTHSMGSRREYIPDNTADFTAMLARLLYREYPEAEEARILTYASTLHAIINAYASSEILIQKKFFDETIVREILLSLARQAGEPEKFPTR